MFLKNPTFYETVSKFESEVAKYKYEEDEIENQEFHELIKRWQDFLTRTHSLEGVAARDAILEKIKLKDAK